MLQRDIELEERHPLAFLVLLTFGAGALLEWVVLGTSLGVILHKVCPERIGGTDDLLHALIQKVGILDHSAPDITVAAALNLIGPNVEGTLNPTGLGPAVWVYGIVRDHLDCRSGAIPASFLIHQRTQGVSVYHLDRILRGDWRWDFIQPRIGLPRSPDKRIAIHPVLHEILEPLRDSLLVRQVQPILIWSRVVSHYLIRLTDLTQTLGMHIVSEKLPESDTLMATAKVPLLAGTLYPTVRHSE